MERCPRLLVCLPLLATSACAADAIAGPPAAPAPVIRTDVRGELHAAKAAAARPDAVPVVFYCTRTRSDPTAEPLYIIDGTISTERDALARLDANAIDTIEVMKGPQAAPIYGSRAAAGAVIITTRSPRPAGP